ncbi:MAG: glycosyltransferase family 4 protein [Rhodothermales bacterium]|nr:glycosyltransferase family 4 protein [Rhodothermales bacterium]
MSLPKRVLFITYYFPPSGGSGVQRPVKFVKYLPEFDWHPTVLTVSPDKAAYVDRDSALASDIPESVDVIRTSSWDPYGLYARLRGSSRGDSIVMHMSPEDDAGWKDRLSLWFRANLFIPDARIGWVPYVVKEARKLHRAKAFDAIVTTSPPHSVHLAGRRLANRLEIPWLADFRDPWTNIFYRDFLPTLGLVDRFEKKLERKIVQRADSVVTVSKRDHEFYEDLRGRRVSLIPNGYDPDDMPSHRSVNSGTFVLAHVGVLNETRNPDALWKALATFEDAADFRLELTGRMDDEVSGAVQDLPVSKLVTDNVSHSEAIEKMFGSSLLFFVVNRGTGNESMIPAKVYEYLASGVRILGIGPTDGDAARLIEETSSGQVFDYGDVEGIRSFLESEAGAWRRGEHRAGCSSEDALAYSRRELTAKLAAELTSITLA